jgi:transcriptional pleiotropic regulator of transition state genes
LKSTGIVRKVDELGRIVLPKELRVTLNIHEKDPLEIFVDDDNRIILQKYEPACVFCNGMNGIINFGGHNICHDCLEKLAKKVNDESK